jgi:hypothetical protein
LDVCHQIDERHFHFVRVNTAASQIQRMQQLHLDRWLWLTRGNPGYLFNVVLNLSRDVAICLEPCRAKPKPILGGRAL